MASFRQWTRPVKLNFFQGPTVTELFDQDHIEHLCSESGHQWRESFWNPALTPLTFPA
jgi:hypothetical protein